MNNLKKDLTDNKRNKDYEVPFLSTSFAARQMQLNNSPASLQITFLVFYVLRSIQRVDIS